MWIPVKPIIPALFCAIALSVLSAQTSPRQTETANSAPHTAGGKPEHKPDRTLSPDDGLSVIAAALDSKVRRDGGNDCSHLVHAIYERAGFRYAYASSDDLYDGVEGFRRVWHPQPGDVIVWRGHAGIVVRPSRHVFFSFLTAGPGTDDYQSAYWTARGIPRFYRYVKGDRCAGCTSVNASARQSR
jgi:cell wall-associated NlpC family hydrolase